MGCDSQTRICHNFLYSYKSQPTYDPQCTSCLVYKLDDNMYILIKCAYVNDKYVLVEMCLRDRYLLRKLCPWTNIPRKINPGGQIFLGKYFLGPILLVKFMSGHIFLGALFCPDQFSWRTYFAVTPTYMYT